MPLKTSAAGTMPALRCSKRQSREDVAGSHLWPKGKVFDMEIINLLRGDKCKNSPSASKLPGSSWGGTNEDLV